MGASRPKASAGQPRRSRQDTRLTLAHAARARRPRDALVTTEYRPFRECPDCGAGAVDLRLTHDDCCAHIVSLDRVTDGDRTWFDRHPDRQRYARQISRAEVVELQVAGALPGGWEAAGHVPVTQLGPGLRARTFDGVWIFPRDGAA